MWSFQNLTPSQGDEAVGRSNAGRQVEDLLRTVYATPKDVVVKAALVGRGGQPQLSHNVFASCVAHS